MRFAFFISILFSFLNINAQEHPPLMAYAPELYGAENQNWGISQTSDQTMYFANNSGLLEFNGVNWSLYPVPDNSIVRSVKSVGNDIYSGSYMDFGVWKKNNKNILEYTSLPNKLGIELKDEEQFWKIVKLDDWLVFQSYSRIYLVNIDTNEYSFIESDDDITNIFVVDGVLFFNKKNKGLFKFNNGSTELFLDDSRIVKNKLVGMFEFNGKLLLLTESNGFYFLENDKLSNWPVDTKIDLSSLRIYSTTKLTDNSIVLGTVSKGYFQLTSDGQLKYDLNFENGLSNNTILSVFEDQQNNLWLGLDIGISFINLSTQFTVYNDTKGTIGTVYSSLVYKDYLFLGTNQGLFYKLRESDENFMFVEGTNGQVWSLKEIDGLLFCGHDSGTFVIKNNEIQQTISDLPGTWDFKILENNPSLILQGNYSGLSILEKKSGKWNFRNKVKGFDLSTRFYEQTDGKVFVNHELRGLYELTLSEDLFSFSTVSNISSSVKKGMGSSILNFSNKLFYFSSFGVSKYDDNNDVFNSVDSFTELLNSFSSRSTLMDVKGSDGLKWCFANENILLLSPGSITEIPKTEIIPVSLSNFKKVVSGFENLTKIGSDEYLLGSSNGYFVFNSSITKPNRLHKIKLNSVEASKINQEKLRLALDSNNILDSESNSLYFNYSIPHYHNIVKKKYSYKLEGWSSEWSNWSEESSQVFENLPYGEYRFIVKGKIGVTETVNSADFSFKIKRPWFFSNFAILFYVIMLALLWIVIHNSYKIYYNKQQLKVLKKSEEDIALRELESSQKLMKLNNEKLKLDIESKNRELAISTMSLIKKNEFLNDIKNELKDKEGVQDLKKVIKIIDKNLNNTDDWKLFEEAFNNADKDFLKHIKSLHPNLTPNDLRLCAYLRLNLTSKEIAPLLNISYRSVEVKRYRLRKKIDLPHESSLTSYILEL
ncbi:MAG: triple tyrosine motif-containing protein [Flavobacteriaceae bacterium]|nr:triple tyrosine motif-containing protein [Flavobacteriaceae bacterium]